MIPQTKALPALRLYKPSGRHDSVLEDAPTPKPARAPAKGRKKPKAAAAAAAVPPDARQKTPQRHLAGADWLSMYAPRLGAAK